MLIALLLIRRWLLFSVGSFIQLGINCIAWLAASSDADCSQSALHCLRQLCAKLQVNGKASIRCCASVGDAYMYT